jgi:hypothetical protein
MRPIFVVVTLALFSSLGGCLTSESNAPADEPSPASAWVQNSTITLATSGVYIVPYIATQDTEFSSLVTMDGGTWRGMRIDFVDATGSFVSPADNFLNQKLLSFGGRELARTIIEDRRQGIWEMECLDGGEPFCAPFDNPSGVPWDAEPLVNEPILSNNVAFPAGQNYLLIFAEFANVFEWNITFAAPIWLGPPQPAGEGIVFAPEYLRSELADTVRCGSVTWCGSMVNATFPIDSRNYSFVTAHYYLARVASVYGQSCFVDDQGGETCGQDQFLTFVNQFYHTLGFSGTPTKGLRLETTILGGAGSGQDIMKANATAGATYWAMWGSMVWFDLPSEHPGDGYGRPE